VIFEGIVYARFGEVAEVDHSNTRARKSPKKVRSSLMFKISRNEKSWIDSALGAAHRLAGLDLKSSIQFIVCSISQQNESFKIRVLEDSRFMELCVQLMNGHPLALELLAQDFCRRRENPKSTFVDCSLVSQWHLMRSGSRISPVHDALQNCDRSYVKARIPFRCFSNS